MAALIESQFPSCIFINITSPGSYVVFAFDGHMIHLWIISLYLNGFNKLLSFNVISHRDIPAVFLFTDRFSIFIHWLGHLKQIHRSVRSWWSRWLIILRLTLLYCCHTPLLAMSDLGFVRSIALTVCCSVVVLNHLSNSTGFVVLSVSLLQYVYICLCYLCVICFVFPCIVCESRVKLVYLPRLSLNTDLAAPMPL